MLLLAFVPFAPKFNAWTKSNTKQIDESQRPRLGRPMAEKSTTQIEYGSLPFPDRGGPRRPLPVGAILPAVLAVLRFSSPQQQLTVLIVTVIGRSTAADGRRLGERGGSSELGNVLALGHLFALIASRANFAELTKAPLLSPLALSSSGHSRLTW